MNEYDFALIFKLSQPDINAEVFIDQLYVAGCHDALLGVGKKGYLSLDFIRESSSAFEAVNSAISNVKSVLTDAKLIHVSHDPVGVKELADIFQCTRQNIQKSTQKTTFPLPVYKSSQSIWHLAKVLKWFTDQGHNVKQELLDIAELAMLINLQIDKQAVKPQILSQADDLILA